LPKIVGKWSQQRRRGSAPVAQIYPPDPGALTMTVPDTDIWLIWGATLDPDSWFYELWVDDFGGTLLTSDAVAAAFRTVDTTMTITGGLFYRARMRAVRGGIIGPWTNSIRQQF